MIIDHIAIWTKDLDSLKEYYTKFFSAVSGSKYINETNGFESYFLRFSSGGSIEIMTKPEVVENIQHSQNIQGFAHLAFEVETVLEVDQKAMELRNNNYQILKGPRRTGDGYYEFETIDPDGNRIEVTTKILG